jgi:hypothetical protein
MEQATTFLSVPTLRARLDASPDRHLCWRARQHAPQPALSFGGANAPVPRGACHPG